MARADYSCNSISISATLGHSLWTPRGIHAESTRASPAFIPPPGISEESSDSESEEDLECLEDFASPDEGIIIMSSCPSIDIAVPSEVNHSGTSKSHSSEVGVRGLPKDLESKPELIPDYMKCCTGSQDELQKCCIALQAVFNNEDARTAKVVEAGGVEVLVDVLHQGSRHSQIQQSALWALWTLGSKEVYQHRVTLCGALGAAVTAMSLHPKDAAVQAQAIWCIYVLCAKNWENRARVVAMGARELIKSAVAFHAQDSSTFTEYAHTCLACLYEVKSEELLAPYQRLRKLATERQQKARAMVLPGDSPSTSRSGTPASQSSNFAGVGEDVTQGRGPLAPYQRRAMKAGLISPGE